MTETFPAQGVAQQFRTKAELAAEHIKQMIMSGQAPPGTKIVTRVVAQAVGISDTPVREAIKQLVSEEWLVERPHIGAVVADFTVQNVRELYGIRAALTSLALQLHQAPLSGARLAAVDEVLAGSTVAIAAGDVAAFAALNRRFHSLLCDTEQSRLVHRMLVGLWSKTETAQRGFRLVPWRLPQSHAEHVAIRDALAEGDIARASELQHAHEMAAMNALIQAMDGEP
ncbi:GntR family transcriptional regulator [Sphaerisporangium krabiense]|uniref:DNA-binding GntR family transcriptional regulator n=1 Tax=Sphaerisporangium krabiense TaxID=763782 RepID=A0A7W8Z256_9ACTN|nr:GntR family transcriptional regulator [Sphaerisporangium krabiense]MBB5625982.1 DNA-binding GntR family transcriptional regulator [Sphaerisporangium krabiense]GII64785.1 GntR family transcriptional regulator [Sphaerisporangium krabiense]